MKPDIMADDASRYDDIDSFYDKLHKWYEEDNLPELPSYSGKFDHEKYKIWQEAYNRRRNATIIKHISSTHTWIKGKERWSKKRDNWFFTSFECKVCKMYGSAYHDIASHLPGEKVDFENGDLPSKNPHGFYISKTCEEVCKSREEYRKKRKGSKCISCGTYGCKYNSL